MYIPQCDVYMYTVHVCLTPQGKVSQVHVQHTHVHVHAQMHMEAQGSILFQFRVQSQMDTCVPVYQAMQISWYNISF